MGIFFSKAMYNSSTLELIELDVWSGFLENETTAGKNPAILQFFPGTFSVKMRWNFEISMVFLMVKLRVCLWKMDGWKLEDDPFRFFFCGLKGFKLLGSKYPLDFGVFFHFFLSFNPWPFFPCHWKRSFHHVFMPLFFRKKSHMTVHIGFGRLEGGKSTCDLPRLVSIVIQGNFEVNHLLGGLLKMQSNRCNWGGWCNWDQELVIDIWMDR